MRGRWGAAMRGRWGAVMYFKRHTADMTVAECGVLFATFSFLLWTQEPLLVTPILHRREQLINNEHS